ncbi:phosphotransferase family protein [Bradyrhizobium guangdongense]|uniref:phosphotransferase family protein n=1 Tax=Bradyrhizobium guangdongense TaxID=1325090 RepID=UPI00164268FD|nr:aminoglycoside phosphotransferase family protein [Bradyrhizobium guangdongense]
MISSPFIASYLVQHRLIKPGSVVAGLLEITPLSGRNYNFLVRDRTLGLVLKQGIWLEENRKAFQAERRFYREIVPLLSPELQAQIPSAVLIDDHEEVLGVEFVPDAVTMFQALQAFPSQAATVGRRLGEFMGRLHGASTALESCKAGLSHDVPWALKLHRPGAASFRLVSPGSYRCLKALQCHGELCAAMQRLQDDWRPECIIHGDIKSDNLLFTVATHGATRTLDRLSVVDWELCQLGDPAWDIAGFFQGIFLYWIFSFPIVAAPSLDRLAQSASVPLIALRTAVIEFMRAYADACGAPSSRETFERAFVLSGARLVQFAVEYAQHQHEQHALQHCEMALQVAERAICVPGWARHALLEATATAPMSIQ